ncbi:ephrin-B2-like [Xiphophorus maculatus]|uniref:Ephrin-B3 n=1 Tax=Xiphophorus maculatus TaxID=8083 RepID=A0A3B5QG23_XIPMA|nr:ephrin-B2-like [Xiphophorus maculatus]XP_027894051.1 ephrin-B2-like [Xiphophorus couchianus]XP_032438469.1 ephrin-B2-like [Xiphophorus hellerii]
MGPHMLGVRVEMACRRSGNGLWVLLVFLLDLLGTTASNMEPIYWNSMNERFRDDKGYVLYPQIGDRLDLICPPLDTARSTPEYEFYKLYLVSSREQADRCEVMGAPNIVLTCDEPTRERRFTIKFQEFSPNLWGHEFKSLHDYYIIATSDGTRQGLDSMRGGVCATKGMKVVLKVGQSQYGLPPKKDQPAGRTTSRIPGGNSTQPRGPFGDGGNGENGPLESTNIAFIAGVAGGSAFLLLVTAVICVVCYRRRHAKHSDTHHPPLSLSSLTSPKRGGGGGITSSNNNGSEPSDIIIPLRTSDSAYCPHYEKVSGDYGHPVYIVQEMPPQSPANIYYKV